MNYIWNNYKKDLIYRIDDNNFSPYIEDIAIDTKVRNVNPLIRFGEIFYPLVELFKVEEYNSEEGEAFLYYIENIIFHYLAQLDRKTGIHRFSIEEFEIEEEIKRCYYGELVAKTYLKLIDSEKKIIKNFLRLQNYSNGRELFFREVIQKIFINSLCYFYPDDNKIIVYLPQRENDTNVNGLLNQEKFEMIQDLFIDVTANVKIFWEYHFGIINRDETMKIDNISIY